MDERLAEQVRGLPPDVILLLAQVQRDLSREAARQAVAAAEDARELERIAAETPEPDERPCPCLVLDERHRCRRGRRQ